MADQWYYNHDGQQFGPLAASEIKRLALSGNLKPDDLVWKAGMTSGRPASQVKGLFFQVPSVVPPPIPQDDESPPSPKKDQPPPTVFTSSMSKEERAERHKQVYGRPNRQDEPEPAPAEAAQPSSAATQPQSPSPPPPSTEEPPPIPQDDESPPSPTEEPPPIPPGEQGANVTPEIQELVEDLKKEGATYDQAGMVINSIEELSQEEKREILKSFLSVAKPDPPSAPTPPPPSTEEPPPLPVGFFTYFFQHFRATRWPGAVGICLGLVAIPAVSLTKPLIGFRGLCFVMAGAAALSLVSGIWYTFSRLIAYYLDGQRSVPHRARSIAAPLAYGALMFLIPMVPWVAGEFFTPPHGLLATIFPDLRKEQARWFGLGDEQPRAATEPGTSPTPAAQTKKSTPRPSDTPSKVSQDNPAQTTPTTTVVDKSDANNSDAIRIRKIVDAYQKSASAAFEDGVTSLQQSEILDSASKELEAAFGDFKTIMISSTVRDVTKSENGFGIHIATPEELRLRSCQLRTEDVLYVEGNENKLMQVKGGDSVIIRGRLVFSKGSLYGLNARYYLALVISPAATSAYGRPYVTESRLGKGSQNIVFIPIEGATCQIGETTWNLRSFPSFSDYRSPAAK